MSHLRNFLQDHGTISRARDAHAIDRPASVPLLVPVTDHLLFQLADAGEVFVELATIILAEAFAEGIWPEKPTVLHCNESYGP